MGRRFRFVRFADIKNPRRLEQELNTILIGSMKMHVNFPRFGKRPVEGEVRRVASSKSDRDGKVPSVTRKASERTTKSYAQVVSSDASPQGNNQVERLRQELSAPEEWHGPVIMEGDEWLKRSEVGVLKNLDVVPLLQDATMLSGFNHIQVHYLRDDKVLLNGPEGFNLEAALFESEDVFDVVIPWSPSVITDHRVSWVRCFGFPLHMWTKDCFDELVRSIGVLVSIDSNTTSFSNLEFARLLI